MTDEEQVIQNRALDYARRKQNKKRIACEHVDQFDAEKSPVSVFMAGSPGAGKTESAKALIEALGGQVLRIDNDDLRKEFADYSGTNSHLFQDAATRLVEAIHDRALVKSVSFVLDTTLSNFDKARKNIERSLKREREVIIIFVYQEPHFAWKFVQAREVVEGRRVPPDVFVEQFLESQVVVNQLKAMFEGQIVVHIILKDIDGTSRFFHANISSVDQYLTTTYDRPALEQLVGLEG